MASACNCAAHCRSLVRERRGGWQGIYWRDRLIANSVSTLTDKFENRLSRRRAAFRSHEWNMPGRQLVRYEIDRGDFLQTNVDLCIPSPNRVRLAKTNSESIYNPQSANNVRWRRLTRRAFRSGLASGFNCCRRQLQSVSSAGAHCDVITHSGWRRLHPFWRNRNGSKQREAI